MANNTVAIASLQASRTSIAYVKNLINCFMFTFMLHHSAGLAQGVPAINSELSAKADEAFKIVCR